MAGLKIFTSGLKLVPTGPRMGKILYSARPKSAFQRGQIEQTGPKFKVPSHNFRHSDFVNFKSGIRSQTKLHHWGSTVGEFNTSFRGFCTQSDGINMVVEAQPDTGITYKLSIPLPSQEKCLFVTSGNETVKSFLEELQNEDSSISKAAFYAGDARIAGSTPLKQAIRSGFSLEINGNRYEVEAAATAVDKLSQKAPKIPITPGMLSSLKTLKNEIWPLIAEKYELDRKAVKHSNMIIYGGFGYLVAQWLFLARLTWWELNWDVMEPITYFITFGTAILGYAYFMLSKREYTFADLREAIIHRQMNKLYNKKGFNRELYESLENQIKEIDPNAIDELLEKARSNAAVV